MTKKTTCECGIEWTWKPRMNFCDQCGQKLIWDNVSEESVEADSQPTIGLTSMLTNNEKARLKVCLLHFVENAIHGGEPEEVKALPAVASLLLENYR